jgi:glycosyltransferase involved in cell wall biosynthesis
VRILGVYNTRRIGGGEVSFTLSLELARSGGMHILAAVPEEGPLTSLLDSRGLAYELLPMPTLRSVWAVPRLLFPSPEWIDLARRFEPDLIHCNGTRAAMYGQSLGRRIGVPSVFHLRIAEPDPIADRFLLRRVDAVVSVSRTVQKRLPDKKHQAKHYILANAVDLDQYQKRSDLTDQIRREWLGDGSALVGIIGMVSPVKGHDRLVEYARKVVDRLPGTRFVVVGELGPDQRFNTRLKQRISELDLSTNFVFTGFLSNISDVYHALDLVVFPSRSEGFGRVVIEAGAARCPLLSSDLGAIREMVPETCAEFLVDFDDEARATDRMIRLLSDPELSQRISGRLHDHVVAHFGKDPHQRRLVELYEDVIANKDQQP